MTARTCKQYAQKETRGSGDGWFWCHFATNPTVTRMYSKSLPVIEVKVIEDENGDYWSWWDNKDGKFSYTSHFRAGVTMCFPYSIKEYTERGEGVLLKVRVEELRQV